MTTKRWRPDGWEIKKREWFKKGPHGFIVDGAVFEGGADMILDKLRTSKSAWKIAPGDQQFEITGKVQSGFEFKTFRVTFQPELKGTLVLIPDDPEEEVQK